MKTSMRLWFCLWYERDLHSTVWLRSRMMGWFTAIERVSARGTTLTRFTCPRFAKNSLDRNGTRGP